MINLRKVFLNFVLLTFLIGVSACAFKSEEMGPTSSNDPGGGGATVRVLDPDGDMDGDGLTNKLETQLGRKHDVADLPDLQVSFLQNYKITAKSDDKEFVLDTKHAQSSPDFRYRVGSLFVREHANQTAASIGKFSAHYTGVMHPNDLSWVKYPEIDQAYFQNKSLEYQKIFGEEIPKSISVVFENSLRLKPSHYFKSIKNVVLNFYYYDYEAEGYRLLKQDIVPQNFMNGVNEVVTIRMDYVPPKLLTENYFKKGEFIISEVYDFEIPDMGVTYRELLNSVKAKCVPVIVNNPHGLTINYVGIDGGGKNTKTFAEILASLYEKNYTVEANEVTKIDQFENNLDDYTYLKEVREKDKNGKWFILTSPFNGHYSDHQYNTGDHIVLNYVTGKELAEQSKEKLHGVWGSVSGGDSFNVIPLGNISPNSEIHLELYPGRFAGERLVTENRDYHERPSSCGRNCIGGVLEVDCIVKVNFFAPFDEPLEFKKNLKDQIAQLKLVINNEEFSIVELAEKKQLKLSWNEKGHLHIKIAEPNKIMELHEARENIIALKVESFSENAFQGTRLESVGGQHGNACPTIVARATSNWRIPVSESSIMMEQFRQFAAQGLPLIPDKTYYQRFNFALSSLINNYYN
jgi:hypothetical protein